MQGLLRHLVEESTSDQFSLLLLVIREALNSSRLRAGSYRVRWQMTGPDTDVEWWFAWFEFSCVYSLYQLAVIR